MRPKEKGALRTSHGRAAGARGRGQRRSSFSALGAAPGEFPEGGGANAERPGTARGGGGGGGGGGRAGVWNSRPSQLLYELRRGALNTGKSAAARRDPERRQARSERWEPAARGSGCGCCCCRCCCSGTGTGAWPSGTAGKVSPEWRPPACLPPRGAPGARPPGWPKGRGAPWEAGGGVRGLAPLRAGGVLAGSPLLTKTLPPLSGTFLNPTTGKCKPCQMCEGKAPPAGVVVVSWPGGTASACLARASGGLGAAAA